MKSVRVEDFGVLHGEDDGARLQVGIGRAIAGEDVIDFDYAGEVWPRIYSRQTSKEI